jgi:hypothetical protein
LRTESTLAYFPHLSNRIESKVEPTMEPVGSI